MHLCMCRRGDGGHSCGEKAGPQSTGCFEGPVPSSFGDKGKSFLSRAMQLHDEPVTPKKEDAFDGASVDICH